MTTLFLARPYGKFIRIQSNLTRNKLYRTNQEPDFLGGNINNKDNVRDPIQIRRDINPNILKDDFSSKTDPSTFISVAPVLFDWSNKTF